MPRGKNGRALERVINNLRASARFLLVGLGQNRMSVDEHTQQPRISRRQLLRGAGVAAVGAWALDGSRLLNDSAPSFAGGPEVPAPQATTFTFHSRPDLRIAATATTGSYGSGSHLFLGPKAVRRAQAGPLILDQHGHPVWFKPVTRWASNVRVQQYRGAPVLTWWEGVVDKQGYGAGEGVIVDTAYREVTRVRAGYGHTADLHEFALTPQGTALITCRPQIVPADLSSIGGPGNGTVFESIIQEIDVATGRVVFQWGGLDHVPVADSYKTPGGVCDYLHVNSIEVLPDGHLLISARNTWALYKLDRRSGHVIWRLGGKSSDFAIGRGARFAWQHDARRPAAGAITVFDNGSDGPIRSQSQSRGLRLAVDETGRSVRLSASYRHPDPLLASSMGSVQTLPQGRVMVGWGAEPFVSEFTAQGSLVADLRMVSEQLSYRGLRLPWHATPTWGPALAVRRASHDGSRTLYVSWNGATDIAYWQVLTGRHRTDLRPVGTVARRGFETAIPLGSADGYAAVVARDRLGGRRATSTTIAL